MTEEPFLPWDVGIFDQIHQVNTNLELAAIGIFFEENGRIFRNKKRGWKSLEKWKLGVSKNRGIPKWMVYNGKPY